MYDKFNYAERGRFLWWWLCYPTPSEKWSAEEFRGDPTVGPRPKIRPEVKNERSSDSDVIVITPPKTSQDFFLFWVPHNKNFWLRQCGLETANCKIENS